MTGDVPVSPSPRANNVLVESLSSALSRGEHSLGTVPGLLKRLLSEDAWRDFDTRRGERVHHDRWHSFVVTPPLRGLGATEELIDRIVGTDDVDLLRLLRDAKKVGPGTRSDLSPGADSTPGGKGEDSSLTVQRLAIEAPDEYEAVRRGERSINAAAIRAGIRKHRVPVRLDSAESAAQTLRKHMTRETRVRLAELLTQED